MTCDLTSPKPFLAYLLFCKGKSLILFSQTFQEVRPQRLFGSIVGICDANRFTNPDPTYICKGGSAELGGLIGRLSRKIVLAVWVNELIIWSTDQSLLVRLSKPALICSQRETI